MRLSLKANVLIDKNGHARLADTGLLTFVSDPANLIASSSTTNAGAARWTSPELLHPEYFDLEDSQPTKESDRYSLGMVILEVLSSQPPFALHGDFIIIQKVTEGEHPERPEEARLTNDLWRTLEQCWSRQPKDRPTVEAVLRCLEHASTPRKPLPPCVKGDGEAHDCESVSVGSCYCRFCHLISDLILTLKLFIQRAKH
jgi:serine/threonine protein kinase